MFHNNCMFHFFPLAFSLWNFNSSIYGESPLTNDFLITCFVIKITKITSDVKRVTKKGKKSQNVVKCVIDFPPSIEILGLYLIAECSRLRGSPTGGIKSSLHNVTTGQSMPLNFIKVTL